MTVPSAVRLLVGACFVATSSASFAQRGFSTRGASRYAQQEQQQRQKAQQLMQARQQLAQEEQAAISEANEQLAAAKKAHRQAGKELTATRERAQKGIEDSLGLKRLQDELAAVQADYKKVAEPVVARLKASDEYVAAEKKAASAKLKIQRVHADTSLSESEKKAQLGELIGDSMAAGNLEQLTLRKDQGVSNARERVEAAQAKVAEARKKSLDKAEKDSTVSTAQQAVESAFAQVKAAEANLASIQGRAAAAEQQLAAGILPQKSTQSGKGQDNGQGGKKN
ncbi:MAG TPA: hypothetical protein VM510_12050 [Caulifigura sp.]|nr:hypothetical protein [Caulifigura sp.]